MMKETIKKNRKELDKFLDKELGELEVSKELQKTNKDDLLIHMILTVYTLVLRWI